MQLWCSSTVEAQTNCILVEEVVDKYSIAGEKIRARKIIKASTLATAASAGIVATLDKAYS